MRTHINCKAMLEADRMPPSFASPIHANSQEIAMATKIKVNGVDRTVDVDGDTPLLWVLRDVLGMTGTKFGCGVALCGACTVHIDGVAARSCISPIDSIGNSKITTIEAMGATAAGAKIQKAWLDREVVQCGYCQSGQIMSASALLRATRIRPIPISTTRCPATSAAVGPTCAFAKRSSRPRNRADREAEMILDHLTSLAAGADPSPSANDLSRRRFLQVGSVAGGGLMLSLHLPSANGDAEAAPADGFVPNAFIRIQRDGQIVLTMPYVEMGQGTYTSIQMLIAEELEVDLKQV